MKIDGRLITAIGGRFPFSKHTHAKLFWRSQYDCLFGLFVDIDRWPKNNDTISHKIPSILNQVVFTPNIYLTSKWLSSPNQHPNKIQWISSILDFRLFICFLLHKYSFYTFFFRWRRINRICLIVEELVRFLSTSFFGQITFNQMLKHVFKQVHVA